MKPFRQSVRVWGFNRQVNVLAPMGSGMLVGGDFTSSPNSRSWKFNRFAKLNADGSPDLSVRDFLSGFNGEVRSIVHQSDGKILVGGLFTHYSQGDSTPSRLIRLNADGTRDTDFNKSSSNLGFDNSVFAVAVQSDGKILVGGSFTTYNAMNIPDRLVRLNADGSVDRTFNGTNAGFDGTINAIAVQSDGKILVGGNFTTYNQFSGAPDRLVRLNTERSLDTEFDGIFQGFDGEVFAIAVQGDGKILVGGDFSSHNADSDTSDRLVRLYQNGAYDPSFNGFNAGFNRAVNALAIQKDGKVLVGGNFTSFNLDSSIPKSFVRLNGDGSRDQSFRGITGGFNSSVHAVAIQRDGKILVGGEFDSYNGDGSAPDRLIRLHDDGSRDLGFNGTNSGFDGGVYSLVVQNDDKVLLGGKFALYNWDESTPDRLVRLRADGSRDASFNGTNAGFNHHVRTLAVQGDGKVIVGGWFTSYNGEAAAPDYLIRVNTDGSRDRSFNGTNAGFNGGIESVKIQSDGKILAAGLFTSYNGSFVPNNLIRLHPDGSRDTSFNSAYTGPNAGFDGLLLTLALQANGKILVGGGFTRYNGKSDIPNGLIRLHSDGNRDDAFTAGGSGFSGGVAALQVLSDGKILVGGNFKEFNGVASTPDNLVRLLPDGTRDLSFNGTNAGANSDILSVAVQSDGRAFAGGSFSAYNGSNAIASNLLRVSSDGNRDPSFNGQRKGFVGTVRSLFLESGNTLWVGGEFTSYNGDPLAPNSIIKLNLDGSVDSQFMGQEN